MSTRTGTARTNRQLREYRALPLFAGCSSRQLHQVVRAATRLHFEPGNVLVNQGQREGQFVIVLSGIAEVRRDDQPVDEIGPGDFFGEIALVRRLLEPADIAAHTALTVDVIAPREFAALYADVDPVRRRIDHALEQRLTRWIRPSAPRAGDAVRILPFVAPTADESTPRRSRRRRAGQAGVAPRLWACRCPRRQRQLLP